jgi:hypothetical protein
MRHSKLVLLLSSTFIAACADAPVQPPEAVSASLRGGGRPESRRDQWAQIAGLNPGFAGAYLRGDGKLVVRMAASDNTELRARGSVAALKQIGGIADDQAYVVETAPVNFAELRDELVAVEAELLRLAPRSQFSVHIDVQTSKVVVGATEQVLAVVRPGLDRTASSPRVTYETRLAPIARPGAIGSMQGSASPSPGGIVGACSTNLRCILPVTSGGSEIGRRIMTVNGPILFNCSLGHNVALDQNPGEFASPVASERYFITGSHCSQTFGFNAGAPDFVRQNMSNNSTFGNEVSDATWYVGASGRPGRFSDAALFRYFSSRASNYSFGRAYVTPNPGSVSIYATTILRSPFGVSGELAYPFVGAPVAKTGRTTGTTQGSVLASCVDVFDVGDADPTRGQRIDLFCQIRVSLAAGAGDSGGPVWYPGGTYWANATAAGIISACATNPDLSCVPNQVFVSDIYYVVQELKVMPDGSVRNIFVQP